jgi:hypothetical protein
MHLGGSNDHLFPEEFGKGADPVANRSEYLGLHVDADVIAAGDGSQTIGHVDGAVAPDYPLRWGKPAA